MQPKGKGRQAGRQAVNKEGKGSSKLRQRPEPGQLFGFIKQAVIKFQYRNNIYTEVYLEQQITDWYVRERDSSYVFHS